MNAAPLADVLLATARTVQAVLAGASLTDALTQCPPELRPATQAVSFHAMRRLGTARALRSALVPRKPSNALLDALLLTALALLETATADTPPAGSPRYAPYTIVDQAVRACNSQRKLAAFKGLVNACLRRYLRERDALQQIALDSLEGRWNYPAWWVARLRRDYPEHWESLLQAADTPAPMTLRVNRRRATRETVADALRDAGVGSQEIGQDGLLLDQARPVAQLPGFEAGWWSVQDAGAQLAAPLLQISNGMRVLDACAAPGGKTAHLLELADIDLLALDVDAQRLERVGHNLERLGLHARLQVADAAKTSAWWDGQPFDAVLADVPCTASGIVRRHPDIRWLRREDDVARTAVLQERIVDSLWQVTAPDGKLLYATCSVFPDEGERQAQAFLARHADARREVAPGQLLPDTGTSVGAGQHDGFFYALFTKV